MGKVARLWNPQGNRKLRRYWVSYEDQIVIGGENAVQAGVLSVRPAKDGALCARLRAMGSELEEEVSPGNDIAIWINGLELLIGVKAVDDERMLLAFGVPPGARVNVTLESGAEFTEIAKAPPWARMQSAGTGRGIGICQAKP